MDIRALLVVGCAVLIPLMMAFSLSFYGYGVRQADRLGGVRASLAGIALTLGVGYLLAVLLDDGVLRWVVTALLVLLFLVGTWWERRVRRQGTGR